MQPLKTLTNQQIWQQIRRFGPDGDEYAPKTETGIGSKEVLPPTIYEGITQDKKFLRDLLNYNRRPRFIGNYAWAVPSRKAITAIKKFVDGDKVLEINAGNGLWATLLSNIGIDIRATDLEPELYPHLFTEIEKLNHLEALASYPECKVLMTVWPSYSENYAAESLKAFTGNKVVYVGESSYGCTADDEFHELLDKNWKEHQAIKIPQWYGLHDYLIMYIRAESCSSCEEKPH